MHKPIQFKNKILTLHQANIEPNYRNRSVITDLSWEYVTMYLKRNGKRDALIYWKQAEHFFKATNVLPVESAPLTAYYCFLNATKALLVSKNISFVEHHGVAGDLRGQNRVALVNENIKVYGNGVLPSLSKYLGDDNLVGNYSMKDILYNLPFVHRPYTHTYTSDSELFIPIQNPTFVKKHNSEDAWLQFELEEFIANGHTFNKFPKGYQQDPTVLDKTVIRRKKRFKWNSRHESRSINDLLKYHKKLRKQIFYITSTLGPSWYIKRNDNSQVSLLPFSTLSLTFMTMHRLSELARYTPNVLVSHFESQHNWLLTEFIIRSPIQFIDEIATEITGDTFKVTNMK